MNEKLTSKDIKAMVKRVNQRYYDVVKFYGSQSELALEYKSKLGLISTSKFSESRNILQIMKPSQLEERDIKILKNIESFVKTRGQLEESRKGLYIKFYGVIPDNKALQSFVKEIEDIHAFIMNHSTYIYNVSETITNALRRSGSLSSDEFEVLKRIKKQAEDDLYDVGKHAKRVKKSGENPFEINDDELWS